MKRITKRRRGGWFLWIGGACFLAGSLVAGSFGLASSASPGPTVQGTVTANQGTPGSSSWPLSASQSGTWQQEITDGTNVLGTPSNPLRTDPTGTTTQPVSGTVGLGAGSNDIGNVGISGSLPAGSNDIGTVQVASPSPTMGSAECNVPDGDTGCTGDTGLDAAGPVINTISVQCNVKPLQHVTVELSAGAFEFRVPLTFQMTIPGGGSTDVYEGTLSNLNIPAQGGGVGANTMFVDEDYIAASGDGTICTLDFTTTSS
jgi:hypothetical protein